MFTYTSILTGSLPSYIFSMSALLKSTKLQVGRGWGGVCETTMLVFNPFYPQLFDSQDSLSRHNVESMNFTKNFHKCELI